MIHIDKLGIFLSKPVALLLMLIYLVQTGALVYLIDNRLDLEKQISYQRTRITELEEKLQIFRAIDDFQIGFNEEEVKTLTNVIYSESKKYEYDPMFILAVILTESSLKKHQVSEKGAQGLMQMIPYVGADVAPRAGVDWEGLATLQQPETNVRIGSFYLFEQLLKFRDVKKALIAYNVGETRLRGMLSRGEKLPSKYINRVMENYKMLKENYQV